MKRVGMTWRVNQNHWEEYRAIHLDPWPELIDAIQSVGIHNYSIFAFGTRVFAYMEIEGDDPNVALDLLAQTDIKKKWDEEVTVWVMPQAAEDSDIQFMELESIFYSP